MVALFLCQAEDGIRDTSVTGVQTCALPIWARYVARAAARAPASPTRLSSRSSVCRFARYGDRSEERRVGKEGRCRWAPYQQRQKKKPQGSTNHDTQPRKLAVQIQRTPDRGS